MHIESEVGRRENQAQVDRKRGENGGETTMEMCMFLILNWFRYDVDIVSGRRLVRIFMKIF